MRPPLYMPVKYFLTSYWALSDGKRGIRHLDELLQPAKLLLSDWKVTWIGTCTLLRSAVDLFQIDAESRINDKIRVEIRAEWESIKQNDKQHPIFWQFLKKERDRMIHYYQWAAQEVWMKEDGTKRPAPTLLEIEPKDAKPILIMKDGPYKDHNSLDLLKESAEWVEARIFGAIHRAGFDPDEDRNLLDFQKRPPAEKSLLG
jgi:hypothetical protein